MSDALSTHGTTVMVKSPSATTPTTGTIKPGPPATGGELRADLVNPFIESAVETFDKMLGVQLRKDRLYLKGRGPDIVGVSGVIGLGGTNPGAVILNFSTAVAVKAVEAFVGEVYGEVNQDVIDGVGELTNIIAGNAKTRLKELGMGSYEIGLPKIVRGSAYQVSQQAGAPPCMVVSFISPLGPLSLEITLQPRQAAAPAPAQAPAGLSANDVLEATIGLLIDLQDVTGVFAATRLQRLRRLASAMAERLALPDPRRVGWAAACLHLGSIGKEAKGAEVDQIAGRLLRHLQEWRDLAVMIERRRIPWQDLPTEAQQAPTVRGAAVLRVAEELEQMLHDGLSAVSAALRLKGSEPGRFDPAVLEVAGAVGMEDWRRTRQGVPLARLKPGWLLDETVFARDGQILVQRGLLVSENIIQRLLVINGQVGVVEPIWVLPPTQQP